LTEDQTGGTTPQPEAIASDTPAANDHAVATQVADEPATIADAPEAPVDQASTSDSTDGTADAAAAEDTEVAAAEPTTEVVEPDVPEVVDASPVTEAESPAVAVEDAVVAEAEPVDVPEPETVEAPESVSAPEAEAPPEADAPEAPVATSSEAISDADTADAPAASDEEEPEPAPARDLGPEPTTMAELLAEQDTDIKSFKHGDVVEGNVVRIDKDEILVDIGAKSEGVVSNRELFGRHGEGQPALNVGDTVLVYVLQPESPEGHVVLSLRRAGLERKWRAMQEQFETGVIIEAPVIDHNKGGLIVDCGIRGFVPISQIVDFPRRPQNDQPRDAAQEIAEKLQPFVGRKLRLKILEVNRKANRLILSEKVALYEERREKRDELFSSLQVGQTVKGTVRSIAPFGVFIDLGGIDGLVHKSELSWNKVNNPESGYKVGEEVEAEVIDINHERGRISLSIRRLQPDPWHSTVADFKVGDVIDGTVTKLVNFGAFVRVRDGLEGLIHISELSHQRVAHPADVVHEGQQLKLKIISLDSERHRLGLSLKQAEEPPARPAAEPSAPGAPRAERRPRPERSYSMSDAVQEPEGGIDNTLASAFAQVRQQLAEAGIGEVADEANAAEAAEAEAGAEAVEEIVETVAADEVVEETAAAEAIETIVENLATDEAEVETDAAARIDQLGDAAVAFEADADPALAAAAEVVEEAAATEAAQETAAADDIAEIVETVAADEAAEETATDAAVEDVVETVAADDAAIEETAAEAVKEIADETVEANTTEG
jgi:small subunit ribosomal protein S1